MSIFFDKNKDLKRQLKISKFLIVNSVSSVCDVAHIKAIAIGYFFDSITTLRSAVGQNSYICELLVKSATMIWQRTASKMEANRRDLIAQLQENTS